MLRTFQYNYLIFPFLLFLSSVFGPGFQTIPILAWLFYPLLLSITRSSTRVRFWIVPIALAINTLGMWIAYLGAFNMYSNPDLIEFTASGVFGVLAYAVLLNLGFFFPVTLDRYFSMWFGDSRPYVTGLMFPCAWAAVWKIYSYVS
jgi:hypothetical protein